MLRKKSNRLLLVIITSILLLIAGCNKNNNADRTGKISPRGSKSVAGVSERNRGELPDSLSVSSDSLQANIEKQQAVEQKKAEARLAAETLTILEETRHAIEALDKDNKDEALQSMEKVLGKLEILLARDPDLALVPIDASSEVINLVSDLKKIKKMRKEVEDLVDKGHLQAARRLLNDMVSEIRVTTSNIPLETYPMAIKTSARLIDEGKTKEAKTLLSHTLTTVVVTEVSIPIPVINAQLMVDTAADTVNTDSQKALALLKDAQYQLQIAEALGYGDRDREFKDIIKDIEKIKNKIKRQEKTGSLFDSLKVRLQNFKKRISK